MSVSIGQRLTVRLEDLVKMTESAEAGSVSELACLSHWPSFEDSATVSSSAGRGLHSPPSVASTCSGHGVTAGRQAFYFDFAGSFDFELRFKGAHLN